MCCYGGLIEGDYIETIDGLFFTVKGVHHPKDLTIAYLRYIEKPGGKRSRGGIKYKRFYDLSETHRILESGYPHYLNKINSLNLILQSVPTTHIKRVYKPVEKLKQIFANQESPSEELIIKFVELLSKKSGVEISCFGISGSQLIGLHLVDSDIDLIVYGKLNGKMIYSTLKNLRNKVDWITPYNTKTIGAILKSRWVDSEQNLENLSKIEVGKVLHGLVRGIDYFIRLINTEASKEISSKPLGKVKVRARVLDDSESIYTPCKYFIEVLEPNKSHRITELLSYRGKFTEQAKEGDIIEVCGILEEAVYTDERVFRIVLGGRGDYLLPLDEL
jgi:predicted nucleotidyltransferase